jgi:Ran GTPase-activating protein (RanGAP) involved in mRNA processing and transport
MSVSNDSTARSSTIENGKRAIRSPRPPLLDFCDKVRNNDPSILPSVGTPFSVGLMREKNALKLADALLENTSVTYIKLQAETYTKRTAEAMAKYVRTSKRLQRIRWPGCSMTSDRDFQRREEMLCCFLPALQQSTSLKKLHMILPLRGGPSNLAFENMLTHTQSLQSLTLSFPAFGLLDDKAMAAVQSGLKKNTTLRELKLELSKGASTVSPIFTSLRDHPLLRRLCLRGYLANLTGLETLLLSENSKITNLEIRQHDYIMGLTHHVLQALGRSMQSLQSLDLSNNALGSAGLVELASPALYHNTSIKVLNLSWNRLIDMKCAEILRQILRHNKTITTLDLSGNKFGRTNTAVECIAEGLGSNSTLLNIDLSHCCLKDEGVSTLAQTLGSRNTALLNLKLDENSITSTGVGVLLEMMEQSSSNITDLQLQCNPIGNKGASLLARSLINSMLLNPTCLSLSQCDIDEEGVGVLLEMMEQSSNNITDLQLQRNPIGNEGASLLARSLRNNTLPNLTRLSLYQCDIGEDGFIALVSALQQNNSLLQLDLYHDYSLIERAFLVLAECLTDIKVLQGLTLRWCPELASAMPLLLAGLRTNKSLFRIHVGNCALYSVPPTTRGKAKLAGGWVQEMKRLGYRNRFLALVSAPKERPPPCGVWPLALARVAILPDAIFEVLRSKPNLWTYRR